MLKLGRYPPQKIQSSHLKSEVVSEAIMLWHFAFVWPRSFGLFSRWFCYNCSWFMSNRTKHTKAQLDHIQLLFKINGLAYTYKLHSLGCGHFGTLLGFFFFYNFVKFVIFAIFAMFVTGVFSSQEKSLLLFRFLRYLRTLRGSSWFLLFLSLEFC